MNQELDELNPWAIIGIIASALLVLIFGLWLGGVYARWGNVCVIGDSEWTAKTVICNSKVVTLIVPGETSKIEKDLQQCQATLTAITDQCLGTTPTSPSTPPAKATK